MLASTTFWTYRPTAGLTLLADFQPWSIVKALRNKDFVVSINSTISILIKSHDHHFPPVSGMALRH